jgi:Chitobiase/beta-hexosaminidase C-terminal domain
MDRCALSDETGAPAFLDLKKRFRLTGSIALSVAALLQNCGGVTDGRPSSDASMVEDGSDSESSSDATSGSSSESGPSQESDSGFDTALDSAFDSSSEPNDADASVIDGPIFGQPDVCGEGPPCSSPTFNPSGGVIAAGSTVTITPGAGFPATGTIFYTTDNTLPTHASAIYKMPIRVDQGETIRAIAYAPCACPDSIVGYAAYTVAPNDARSD